jgi:hypothetical protein
MTSAFTQADTNFLKPEETARIAENLAAKYGRSAVDFAGARAQRAHAVGDELAHAAWQAVQEATSELLSRSPWCYV